MPSLPAGLVPGGRFSDWTAEPIAYVALDVDGTLVGMDDRVRDDVADAIAEVKAAGIAIGYATGRMQAALDVLDRRVALPGPHVVHNGALVRMHGATAASWPLTSDNVASLLRIVEELGVYCELYLDEGYLVTSREPRAKAHWTLLGEDPRGLASDLADRSVTKATFIAFDAADNDALVTAVEAAGMAAGPAGSPVTPDMTYINATRGGVDKGSALDTAASLVGTTLAHTMVVGDGDNDLPMLRVAGTAVAMGQASEAVRAAAHLVTLPVDEGGLALALDVLVGSAPRTR